MEQLSSGTVKLNQWKELLTEMVILNSNRQIIYYN